MLGRDWLKEIETEVWSVLHVFSVYEVSSTVLYVMKAMDRGSRQTRKKRIAVVRV